MRAADLNAKRGVGASPEAGSQAGDELEHQRGLILSTLMLEVMRLRNTYRYDTVAPKAMQKEMDVAFHRAKAEIEAYAERLATKRALQECQGFKSDLEKLKKQYFSLNELIRSVDHGISQLRATLTGKADHE